MGQFSANSRISFVFIKVLIKLETYVRLKEESEAEQKFSIACPMVHFTFTCNLRFIAGLIKTEIGFESRVVLLY